MAELFGARPNIAVVGHDGTILAVLASREAGARPFLVGERYVEPRRPEKDLAPKPPFSEFARPESSGSAGSQSAGPQAIRPASSSPGPQSAGPQAIRPASYSRLLELAVTPREALQILEDSRASLLDALSQEEKKLRRRLANIEADVRAADEIPRLKKEGEILKAHLGQMKRGMKHLDATDWSGGTAEKVRVALDPMKTPKEEVAHRFDEARRLERSQQAAAERRAEVDERLAALAAFAARAREAAGEEAVAAIRAEAGLSERAPQAAPGKKVVAPKPEPRKPYRTFVSKDGIEMLVGRTASDNDELTFQVAHGNDFWFHVRDYPGSHVVIRAREDLPEQTLLDAATLAVHFSRADAAGKRDVSWTRRKFVSKARGAPAGQVLLSAHKTIHLRVEPERLKRLLERDPGPSAARTGRRA